MLRFLALTILTVAIMTLLTGQSLTRAASVTTDGLASITVVSASHQEADDDADGCDGCKDCQHSHKFSCPMYPGSCGSCSTISALPPHSLAFRACDRSSAAMQPDADVLSSIRLGLDPPVPRSST
jgi:hypothetical protein